MSILIRGMEMPQDGVTIIEIHSNGATFRYSKSFGGWEKVEDAVPVPKHGRLIDADALENRVVPASRFFEIPNANVVVLGVIKAAPTIIEAEDTTI